MALFDTCQLKFGLSVKHTKIYLVNIQTMRKIFSNFVCFSESPNFNPILKFKNFLWACWFLGKTLSKFVPPIWKLHNPSCHNDQVLYLLTYLWVFNGLHSTTYESIKMSSLHGWSKNEGFCDNAKNLSECKAKKKNTRTFAQC